MTRILASLLTIMLLPSDANALSNSRLDPAARKAVGTIGTIRQITLATTQYREVHIKGGVHTETLLTYTFPEWAIQPGQHIRVNAFGHLTQDDPSDQPFNPQFIVEQDSAVQFAIGPPSGWFIPFNVTPVAWEIDATIAASVPFTLTSTSKVALDGSSSASLQFTGRLRMLIGEDATGDPVVVAGAILTTPTTQTHSVLAATLDQTAFPYTDAARQMSFSLTIQSSKSFVVDGGYMEAL